MDEKEQHITNIMEQVKGLTYEEQKGVCWLIQNIDIIDQIITEKKMTTEEKEEFIHLIMEEKNYNMLSMLLHNQSKDPSDNDIL